MGTKILPPAACHTTRLAGDVTSWLIPDLAESSPVVSWIFESAPQTTPLTANTCGDILPCFAMIVMIKQISLFGQLKLLHAS